jgi:hypothetical protein
MKKTHGLMKGMSTLQTSSESFTGNTRAHPVGSVPSTSENFRSVQLVRSLRLEGGVM